MGDDLTVFLVMGLFYGFYFLDVVFKGLNSIKALSLIILHSIRRPLLENVSNHSLVALRIKLVIISSLNIRKFTNISFQWVNPTFQIVPEISDKFLAIIKYNHHSLVVDWSPLSFLELAAVDLGLDLIVVHETDLPDLLVGEGELVILAK